MPILFATLLETTPIGVFLFPAIGDQIVQVVGFSSLIGLKSVADRQ